MWQQIAEGTQSDLYNLGNYEGRIAEGKRGRLQLNLRAPVPTEAVAMLQNALDMQRVTEVKVSASGSTLSVTWRKGFAWLPIIQIAILTLIVLAVLIVSWQLFKEVEPAVQPWLIAGGIFGLLLVGYLVYKAGSP